MTGARMAYQAGQKQSELNNLKFKSEDYYRQMSGTISGLNSLRTQQNKLMAELAEVKQTSPVFQIVREAEMEYLKATKSGDNSKIIDAKQKVDEAQRVALKRWEEQNPAETAALRKLSTAIAEAEARQSNISTNWMGSTPTSSDLKVKRTN